MTSKSSIITNAERSAAKVRKLKPVHPGEILREEFMEPLKLSANRLALDLRVPATRISDIVDERRAISPDTALRLAQYFRTTPEFWLNLQTRYDLDKTEDEILMQIRRDVHPRKVVLDSKAARARGKG